MRKSAPNSASTRPVSQGSETVQWDTEVPRLGLRQRGTTSSWIVQWRAEGRIRKQRLGRADAIPLPQALELARALLDGAETGSAPDIPPTVAAFRRRYLKDLAPSWKPATHRAHAHDVEHLIVPYGRYGYRRIAALLREAGWSVSDGRIELLWRRERGGSENSLGDCFPVKPESASETIEERTALAEEWLVCSAEAGVSRSCMEL